MVRGNISTNIVTLHVVYPPQNAYMFNAQLSYNQTTNLAPDRYQKYRSHNHLKKHRNGQVC